jgi:hypothetical protein
MILRYLAYAPWTAALIVNFSGADEEANLEQ